MNFLAHFYLSGKSPKLRVGNFIGDAVKGNDFNQYDKEIAEGIIMHRNIDQFADSHPIVIQGKRKLSRYRHYSAVIIDIFYDHFLARNWNLYTETPLDEFALGVYQDLGKHVEVFPKKSRKMFRHMVNYNWLETYKSVEGIGRVLNGMSRRTIFNSKMEKSVEELMKHYEEFDEEFRQFFVDIIEETNKYRK